MTYASDKLYNDVIKKLLGQLASKVKVREIVPHLPCLTLSDREEIEAKREVTGNYNAMTLLIDCLRRREKWPEEFIRALRECEQYTLADEISNAYDQIRGINTQRPAPAAAASGPSLAAAPAYPSAPAPVHVTASASTTLALSTTSVTTVNTAPIQNALQSTPPLLTSPLSAAPAPIHSSPESLSRIKALVPAEAPVSAPEGPAHLHPKPAQPAAPSPPVSAPPAMSPSLVSASNVNTSLQQLEVSFNPVATPSVDHSDDLAVSAISESSSAVATSLPTSTITTSSFQPNTSSQSTASDEDHKIPLAVRETTPSVKHPIQDTNMDIHVSSAVSQHRETPPYAHSTMPPNSQAQAQSPGIEVSSLASHRAVDSEENFSKPGILMGAEPSFASSNDLQISHPHTETTGSSPVQPVRPAPVSGHRQPVEPNRGTEEPCSVTSDDLMLSNSTTGSTGISQTQPAHHPPPESPEVPAIPPPDVHPVSLGNLLPNSTSEESHFPETDASLSPNQPVEDHYESLCPSLQAEPRTLVNIVQIHEEPSILNLSGQSPSMIGNAVLLNENQTNLNHTSPTESPAQSVMSENQPSLKNQNISHTTQKNEVHVGEQAAADADLSACAEPPTAPYQASGLRASGQLEQNEEAQSIRLHFQPETCFIATAVVVGMAAICIAWKLRH